MSQTERILRFMEENDGITQVEAIQEFGCMRLAARIADLKKDGVEIETEMVTAKNRYGERVHFARYRLGDGYEEKQSAND